MPSKSQTDLAEYFFSLGVDLIIGSHPHVLQKMVWSKNIAGEKDGIVVYSMGNFISNQRKPKTDGGAIVRIEFTKKRKELKFQMQGTILHGFILRLRNTGKNSLSCHAPNLRIILISSVILLITIR